MILEKEGKLEFKSSKLTGNWEDRGLSKCRHTGAQRREVGVGERRLKILVVRNGR